jgi:hypothetical protein
MPTVKQQIKDFAVAHGVSLVGIAGPGRFDGPPSLDPTYTIKEAKSIISVALPMNVPAIYDFLGKKSAGPHNSDQFKMSQRLHRISREIAEYVISLGYKAVVVPPNGTYRRSPDMFATRPSFSHRFGAVVSGLGHFGLSGNVVTPEFGAAIYLGTIVTDASLESDPLLPSRHVMDNRCRSCKLCDKTCASKMFQDDEEEYLLINGELHARGKRNNIDLCNTSCFGLHAVSVDKKWSNWGRHWIKDWMEALPDPQNREDVRGTMMQKGAKTGDSAARFEVIRQFNLTLWPKADVEDMLPDYDDLPEKEEDLYDLLVKAEENMGIHGLKDPYVLTCGQCALVCGPDFKETKKRFDLLTKGGFVVPGPEGKMVNVKTLEEAMAIRARYPQRAGKQERFLDNKASALIWTKNYFGLEPKGEIQNLLYQHRVRKACAKAGLEGKEAKAPLLLKMKYLMRLLKS